MKLCNDTITVFNRKLDVESGYDVYYPTVIKNVSWYGTVAVSVDTNGLHAANHYTVRIPIDADFGDKTYIDPIAFKEADSVDGVFTFSQGDIIVKAEVESIEKPSDLHSNYADCCTILGVTDDRRAPNAPHWKVVGA